MDIQDDRYFSLSSHQDHIWQLQKTMSNGALIVSATIAVDGAIDSSSLVDALQTVVERNEVLRTVVGHVPGTLVAAQRVARGEKITVPIVDLSDVSESELMSRYEVAIAEWGSSGRGSRADAMIRAVIFECPAHRRLLHVELSALCADIQTLSLLLSDLAEAYEARQSGRPFSDVPLQYPDVAAWQLELLDGEDAEQGRRFWRQRFGEASLAIDLPLSSQQDKQQLFRPGRKVTHIGHELTSRLAAMADGAGVSLQNLLLTCWHVLLWRMTGGHGVLVGTYHDGRGYEELTGTMGPLGRYLPLLLPPDEQPSTGQLAQLVQSLQESGQEWAEFFTWQENRSTDASAAEPRFHATFAYVGRTFPVAGGGLTLTLLDMYACLEASRSGVLCLEEEGGLELQLYYDTSSIENDVALSMLERMVIIAEQFACNAETSTSALGCLTVEEKNRIYGQLEATRSEYPADACAHELFEAQARRSPDSIAIVCGDDRVTYGALNGRANQLARRLRDLGVGPEVPVAVAVERSADMVVSVLAVLKAGGAYVPVELSDPPDRLSFMLSDARPPVLVTHEHHLLRLKSFSGAVVTMNALRGQEPSAMDCEDVTSVATPDNLAYIIYTSGSTGRPKGVMVTHRGLVNYLSWCVRAYRVGEGQGAPVQSPLGFDLTVTSLFAPLLVGRTVLLLAEGANVEALSAALQLTSGLSLVKITPAHLEILSRQLPAGDASGRTHAFVIGGEALRHEHLSFWRQHAPRTRLINEYGPTETVVGCSFYDTSHDEESSGAVPIGQPIANTQLYVLDRRLRPTPTFVPGELYIGGLGVSRGYLHQAALTAEKFVPDPFSDKTGARLYRTGDVVRYLPDGNIDFLGRVDHQIKVRGYRLELGEIEAVLKEHPAVDDAVAVALEGASDQQRLAAYIVPSERHAPHVRRLLQLQQDKGFASLARRKLPDGTTIFHNNDQETDYLFREIFDRRTYIKNGIEITDESCVFDIGANIGMFTLLISRLNPNAKVFAFEPIPQSFAILRANCMLHDISAELFNLGLSDQTQTAIFTHYPRLSLMSGRYADSSADRAVVQSFEEHQGRDRKTNGWEASVLEAVIDGRLSEENITVQLTTLSDIIHRTGVCHIDLLKIDVERSEIDVLRGISDNHWKIIRQIVVEVHDVEGRLGWIVSMLEDHGYIVVVEKEDDLANTDLFTVYARRPENDLGRTGRALGDRHTSARAAWADPEQLVDDVRRLLRAKLPEYMVPTDILLLESLPLSVNGKVDRQALPAPGTVFGAHSGGSVGPREGVELQLVQVWERLLGTDRVGVTDDFFQIGGNSLLAVRLLAQVHEQFGVPVALSIFLENRTVERLASVVRARPALSPASSIVPIRSSGSKLPFYCVHPTGGNVVCYLELARHLGADHPFFGVQAVAPPQDQPTPSRIEDMAARYVDSLLLARPTGPLAIGGWSMGGLIAYEMASQLYERGRPVALLALIDTVAPASSAGASLDGTSAHDDDDAEWLMRIARYLGAFMGRELPVSRDELRSLGPEQQLTYFVDQARRADLLPPDGGLSLVQGLLRLQKAHMRAARRYVPRAYPNRVTLFRVQHVDSRIEAYGLFQENLDDPTFGWSRYSASPVDVRTLPGDHMTIVMPPNVEALAGQLRSSLVLIPS